eukprot:358645-Chlamydomonas_euryale.AAC.15
MDQATACCTFYARPSAVLLQQPQSNAFDDSNAQIATMFGIPVGAEAPTTAGGTSGGVTPAHKRPSAGSADLAPLALSAPRELKRANLGTGYNDRLLGHTSGAHASAAPLLLGHAASAPSGARDGGGASGGAVAQPTTQPSERAGAAEVGMLGERKLASVGECMKGVHACECACMIEERKLASVGACMKVVHACKCPCMIGERKLASVGACMKGVRACECACMIEERKLASMGACMKGVHACECACMIEERMLASVGACVKGVHACECACMIEECMLASVGACMKGCMHASVPA